MINPIMQKLKQKNSSLTIQGYCYFIIVFINNEINTHRIIVIESNVWLITRNILRDWEQKSLISASRLCITGNPKVKGMPTNENNGIKKQAAIKGDFYESPYKISLNIYLLIFHR